MKTIFVVIRKFNHLAPLSSFDTSSFIEQTNQVVISINIQSIYIILFAFISFLFFFIELKLYLHFEDSILLWKLETFVTVQTGRKKARGRWHLVYRPMFQISLLIFLFVIAKAKRQLSPDLKTWEVFVDD